MERLVVFNSIILLKFISSSGLIPTQEALAILNFQVIPQSICTRYGLAVGANFVWLVRILMIVCYPISYPIGKVESLKLMLVSLVEFYRVLTT